MKKNECHGSSSRRRLRGAARNLVGPSGGADANGRGQGSECPPARGRAEQPGEELDESFGSWVDNPLALEEYCGCRNGHMFRGQLGEFARPAQRQVSKAVDSKSSTFPGLLCDVGGQLSTALRHAFRGGQGAAADEPDNLLDTGIDGGGRRPVKTSACSSSLGGERSLCAGVSVSVFGAGHTSSIVTGRSRHRRRHCTFLDLVHDRRGALLVVSTKTNHEAGRCLYGVTMQPGGCRRS